MLRTIIIVLSVVFLMGCGATAPTKGTSSYEGLPDSMLTACHITKPIKTADYMALSQDDQRQEDAKYKIALLEDLRTCNIRMNEADALNKEKRKLFNKE